MTILDFSACTLSGPEGAPPEIAPDLADELDMVAEMAIHFATSRDIEDALRLGLNRIVRRMGAEAGSLFLVEEAGAADGASEPGKGGILCQACVGPVNITGLRLPLGIGIVGRTIDENRVRLVRDVSQDPDFGSAVDQGTGFTTRSIICAPMAVRGQSLGAIEIINKSAPPGQDEAHFNERDALLLSALAASAALALFNARLAAAMVEQEGVRRELVLAAEIQRAMLPSALPGHYPLAGGNRPARSVSGDFFDILPLGEASCAFALGDVSGKGINAALLMAKTSSLFRCLAKRGHDPAELLAIINEELCETTTGGMFVTMVAGMADLATGRVVLANAGHEPALLHRGGGVFDALPSGAPPLGIVPGLAKGDFPFDEIALQGGCLYLFTDGLTEAPDQGGMLGVDGVQAMIEARAHLAPQQRVDDILAALVASGAALKDDLTLLVVEDRHCGSAPEVSP